MRVVVTGGRNYNNQERIAKVLDWFHEKHQITTLIHGGANGADFWCAVWALCEDVEIEEYAITPRCWKKYGKGAGPRRNQLMIDEGKPNRAIAFPGGNGTADMVSRLQKAEIPITFSRT